MKKYVTIIACILICVASFLIAGAVDRAVSDRGDEREGGTFDTAQEGYVVKNVDGVVCVFPVGNSEPVLVTDIDVRYLRERDRNSVQGGIELDSYEEVLRLIEDFNS